MEQWFHFRSRGWLAPRILLAVALGWAAGCSGPSVAAEPQDGHYLDIVRTLTDPAMQGRGVGTEGIQRARDYLVEQLEAIDLDLAFVDDRGQPTYLQRAPADPDEGQPMTVYNVGAMLRGAGTRADQVVVIGAHYDHLGRGEHGSRSEGAARGRVHPGADDNASGVAAMLLIAKRLAAQPPMADDRRAVIFVAFSGEERGPWGSRHFVKHLEELALESPRIVAMINLDMVGRMRDGELQVASTDGCDRWEALFTRANEDFQLGLDLKFLAWNVGVSDHATFDARNIPAIHLYTGRHDDYHRPSDTADKINAAGAMKIVALTEQAVRQLCFEGAMDAQKN